MPFTGIKNRNCFRITQSNSIFHLFPIISISAHRKWPETVRSASTNQEWTKITIRSYAWSFGYSDPEPSNVYRVSAFLLDPRNLIDQNIVSYLGHLQNLGSGNTAESAYSTTSKDCYLEQDNSKRHHSQQALSLTKHS